MTAYLLRRIVLVLPVVWMAATVVFFGMHFAPGDPASIMLGLYASQDTVTNLRQELGLDQPLLVQYLRFLWNLLQGDLGTSFHGEDPVAQMLWRSFVPTLQLVLASMMIALVFGGLLGIVAAVFENTAVDSLARVLAVVGVSAPIFWVALLLIILFGVQLKWLPVAGYGRPGHMVLPALALSGQTLAFVARLFRSNLVEEKRQDYVRTARAKGVAERVVWLTHILRNSLLSVVTLVGVRFGTLLGGAVVVEIVFAWPGMGTLIVHGVYSRDYPVILGGVIAISLIVTLVNLIVDFVYTLLDPRIVYH